MQIMNAPRTPKKRMPSGGPTQQKKPSVMRSLLVLLGVLALIVSVFPKDPLTHAIASVQSPDGQATAGSPSIAYKGLVISEIMTANSSAVPDDHGEYNDWLEVWNSTGQPINMSGVGLSDRSDRILFLFPDMVLEPNGRLVVFASDTNSADPTGTLHAKFKLSSSGETVYLFDPGAYVINEVSVPILNTDVSYALQADGKYAQTKDCTPGFDNTAEGFQSYRSADVITESAIRINEVMADARTGIYDEDGELSDWIELYNTTDKAISLKNFALSDKESDPVQWRFPQDAVIPAHGYYLVFCSGKDRLLANDKISHTNFRLSAEQETLILSDSRGRLIDRALIDNLPMDSSLGRDGGGNWKVYQTATPGMPNNGEGAAQADRNLRAANTTNVFISEVMSSSEEGSDWVELYNASAQSVSLEGYGLSDDLDRPRKWQFPAGAVIAPGEYKTVLLDGTGSQANGYHANFKLLRAGGEAVSFSDKSGRVLDKISLPQVPTGVSYGRNIGTDGFFYFDSPTMGGVNSKGYASFAQTPSFSIKGGLYSEAVSVTIDVPDGATVRYSLDGSIPTLKHPAYDGNPIAINKTTPIRARAFQEGHLPGETVTQTYFINEKNTLPIVSLVADPDELWNEGNGMLAAGGTLDKSVFPFKLTNGNAPIYRTLGKEPRPGYVEYYLLDGTQVISQGMEFGLQGQYSLDMPQKSFKVRANAEQGDSTFEASLFESRPFTEYKSFVLRNGGNDNVWTRINDDYQSMLIDKLDTTVIHQAVKPVAVYLNGQYWGHYNMRERVDEYFVAQHEGLPVEQAGNMDILEASGTVVFGSNQEFKNLVAKVKTLSPGTNPDHLKYITDRVDVDNYFDYMALEWFFGNSDAGNTRFYKLKGEGQKWRWIFYDSDYGMFNSAYNSPVSYMDPNGAGDQNVNNTLIRKLLENKEMKDKFLTRMGVIFQTLTTQNMLDTFNGLASGIEPEMMLHFERWARYNEKAINADSPLTADGAMRYWHQRLDRSRNVIKKRPTLYYGMVQDYFGLSNAAMAEYFGTKPPMPADAL